MEVIDGVVIFDASFLKVEEEKGGKKGDHDVLIMVVVEWEMSTESFCFIGKLRYLSQSNNKNKE